MGQRQRTFPQSVPVAAAFRAGLCDMAEGVGAGVAIIPRVLSTADADRIEHDDESTGHRDVLQRVSLIRHYNAAVETSNAGSGSNGHAHGHDHGHDRVRGQAPMHRAGIFRRNGRLVGSPTSICIVA